MTHRRLLPAFILALTAAACAQGEADLNAEAYISEINSFREGRLERLLAPTGFLTQVGLFWINDGEYSIGSAEDSDIRLPATAAAHVGKISVTDGRPILTVVDGVEVSTAADDGTAERVSEIELPPDTSGEFVMVTHGSVAWSVVERGGRLAVRVRDFEHPWIQTFGPIPHYDIDPKWRVEARLKRYDEPRVITVNTVIEGFQQNPMSPGVAHFEVDGVAYELEPQQAGDQLFFVFGDLTNRGETYGAGRYLYAVDPGEEETFILDFNKSYSPPCAFNDYSTCPVASPRNRLKVRVEAGELYDKALHYPGES